MSRLQKMEAIEKRLWNAAYLLRANSGLASNAYFTPVMGLILRAVAGLRVEPTCCLSRCVLVQSAATPATAATLACSRCKKVVAVAQ